MPATQTTAPAAAAAAAAPKTKRSSRATAATAATAAADVPTDAMAAVVLETPVTQDVNMDVDAPVVDVPVSTVHPLEAVMTEISAVMKAVQTNIQQLNGLVKVAAKEGHKICKKHGNQRSKRKGTGSNLIKPQKISDELNLFFNNPVGTQMRRSEITKALNTYAEAKNIKAGNNRRVVVIDPSLAVLMNNPAKEDNPHENDQLELFQMLKHLKHHISGDAEVTVGGVATDAAVVAEAVAVLV